MSPCPLIAAHRGGALLWPENSLTAFRNAIALDVDLLELDVHPSADGALAVIHDPTLERTTDGRGAVRGVTTATLKGLRLRATDGALTDEAVPLFDEVLTLVRSTRVGLLVELKHPSQPATYERRAGAVGVTPGPRYEGLEERVLETLGASGLAERTTIMAFNPAILERVRGLAPRHRLALLVGRWHTVEAAPTADELAEIAGKTGATELGLDWRLVDERTVAAARAGGLRLGVWTVNDESTIHRMIAIGVDAITTDRPDLALRAVGR